MNSTKAEIHNLQEELNETKRKNLELLEELKSCALRVIEHERKLIQCTGADDVDTDLNDLQARIEDYNPSDDIFIIPTSNSQSPSNGGGSSTSPAGPGKLNKRSSIGMSLRDLGGSSRGRRQSKKASMSNSLTWTEEEAAEAMGAEVALGAASSHGTSTASGGATTPTKIKTLPPSKGINFAFISLGHTIEYFETERELNMSKVKKVTDEKNKIIEELQSEMKQMEQKITSLETTNSDLKEVITKQQININQQQLQIDKIHDLEEQIDELINEKNILISENDNYKEEIHTLKQDTTQINSNQQQETKDLYMEVQSLQITIEELQNENHTLNQQNQTHLSTITKLKKDQKLKRFDEKFENKANDYKYEDTVHKLNDVNRKYKLLEEQSTAQQARIEELGAENYKLQSKINNSQEEIEHLTIKIEAQEEAIHHINDENSKLRMELQDTKDERDMLLFKCDAQQDAVIAVKRQLELSTSKLEQQW